MTFFGIDGGDHTVGIGKQPRVGQCVVGLSSVGNGTIAATKDDGSLWLYGSNDYGTLGDGSWSGQKFTEDAYSEVPVQALDDVAFVSCGDGTVGAIKKDGSLWMWGNNSQGQLGNGNHEDGNYSTVPVRITISALLP